MMGGFSALALNQAIEQCAEVELHKPKPNQIGAHAEDSSQDTQWNIEYAVSVPKQEVLRVGSMLDTTAAWFRLGACVRRRKSHFTPNAQIFRGRSGFRIIPHERVRANARRRRVGPGWPGGAS